jgi:hypothetical protein
VTPEFVEGAYGRVEKRTWRNTSSERGAGTAGSGESRIVNPTSRKNFRCTKHVVGLFRGIAYDAE